MLMLISPAKSLDMQVAYPQIELTDTQFLAHSKKLISLLKVFSVDDIQTLMGVSKKLALLNQQRFQQWSHNQNVGHFCPAMFAFQGDVYQGLLVKTLDKQSLLFAQQHLRILSGLYGVLRPFDRIQAYRLEMGLKLEIGETKNLYEFWRDEVTDVINNDLQQLEQHVLINLASNEYFKVINLKKITARLITPVFKDLKKGDYKMISFYIKKARGMMVRYVLENSITDVEKIKVFRGGGYVFSPEQSDDSTWVFLR